jgi:micrococcal nuclease
MARSRAVVAVTALAAASVLGVAAAGWWLGDQRRAADLPYRVVEVVDGDTIVVEDPLGARDTVRLLGVDTPETHHPTKGLQCFGPEAAAFSGSRLAGALVRLEDDVQRRDVYGRRLAYVYAHGRRFNDVLRWRGYARFLLIEPNRAHAREMLGAELSARAAGRGLWSACDD